MLYLLKTYIKTKRDPLWGLFKIPIPVIIFWLCARGRQTNCHIYIYLCTLLVCDTYMGLDKDDNGLGTSTHHIIISLCMCVNKLSKFNSIYFERTQRWVRENQCYCFSNGISRIERKITAEFSGYSIPKVYATRNKCEVDGIRKMA